MVIYLSDTYQSGRPATLSLLLAPCPPPRPLSPVAASSAPTPSTQAPFLPIAHTPPSFLSITDPSLDSREHRAAALCSAREGDRGAIAMLSCRVAGKNKRTRLPNERRPERSGRREEDEGGLPGEGRTSPGLPACLARGPSFRWCSGLRNTKEAALRPQASPSPAACQAAPAAARERHRRGGRPQF